MTFTPSFRAAAVALLLAGGAVLHGCNSRRSRPMCWRK